jgi:5'-nucleotidase
MAIPDSFTLSKNNSHKLHNYDWILFDADNTLFHFNDKLGIETLFTNLNIKFNDIDYQHYKKINLALWESFERGEIDATTIKTERFKPWEKISGMSSLELNNLFLAIMTEVCQPTKGAVELINTLHNRVKLGIITNGFIDLQQARLTKHNLNHQFNFVLTSEETNKAKPNPAIFNHAFNIMGQPDKQRVLIVGDNPHSDILGGQKYGIHTCWLNSYNTKTPEQVSPHYHIRELTELQSLIE